MVNSRALIAAIALATGVSSGALAADLLPPPPVVAPPPPVDFGSWYLRGDIGVGATQISGWRDSFAPFNSFGNPPPTVVPMLADLGDSAHVDAGFGYKFGSWFRVDVTGEYRTKAHYRAGIGWVNGVNSGGDLYNANLSSALFLANGYVDLGTWWGVTPYVGASVGLVAHHLGGLEDSGLGYARDASPTNLAWAVSGGLAFNVTPNLKIDLGYRYLDMGNITSNPIACFQLAACWGERQSFHVASHDVRLGFRYALGEPPAPIYAPPPGPLIRKY